VTDAPTPRDEEMVRVAEQLNALDDQLWAAERADHVSEQVAVLRQRSRVWKARADRLEQSGHENHPAVLASMRDAISARCVSRGLTWCSP
jgi:hypothetical protein